MKKIASVLCAFAACLAAASARADQAPSYNGPQSASETAFVRSIQADLNARFPHAADAVRAGYIRYTDVDDTGAISYANLHWTSKDIRHPSQLWYDKNGNLLGADFSTPDTSGARPMLFGVNPGRWYEFDEHIHYVVKDPATGKISYYHYVMAPAWVNAGGSLTNPSAATLVKLGKVKSANDVAVIFDFPKVWDLIVWVKPNPNGAFAEKNPLVTP
ncbi:MAG TPA: hypothetical protein VEJ41_04350 [Candidatus Acidoferrales bacterium]|nr:hypothetical protein [Candidatus Acidoferrales bacterium]